MAMVSNELLFCLCSIAIMHCDWLYLSQNGLIWEVIDFLLDILDHCKDEFKFSVQFYKKRANSLNTVVVTTIDQYRVISNDLEWHKGQWPVWLMWTLSSPLASNCYLSCRIDFYLHITVVNLTISVCSRTIFLTMLFYFPNIHSKPVWCILTVYQLHRFRLQPPWCHWEQLEVESHLFR